ncbi:MAG TPA: OmpA family protein [Vicinamibacterales bacterium]|jgi:outer membrane protein OmpA-like peptidoglycan-associated protein|nr:OmpA family protein [Vicinamibacterales bacterium]
MMVRPFTLTVSLFALCVAHTAHAQAPRPTVPLVTGLAVVASVREPAGDYESVRRVTAISSDSVAFSITAERPGENGEEPTQIQATRTVRLVDLKTARTLKPRISSGWDAEEIYPGTTTSQLSTAGLTELRATGHTALTFIDDGSGGISASTAALLGNLVIAGGSVSAESVKEKMATAVAMGGAAFTVAGTMTSVEPGIVPVSVLVNNAVVALPARHIRGKLTGDDGDRDADMYVLDDPANPLLLQFRVGEDSLTVVRIDWPDASTVTNMESALAARKPVDLYGIYFAFNSAEIRPQSDSTLDEIAAMMKRDPTWKLTVTGHTDNIGGDSSNLALSQRRSAAVKVALVSRGTSADRLATGGSGASAPKATNATLAGRAQNRRVELSRQ